MSVLTELLEKFPVRKGKEQKESFLSYVITRAEKKGISAKIETNGKNRNLVIGNPDTAKTVFTAHYDTPNASIFPNLMTPKNKGLFYAYQFLIVGLMLVISLVPAIVVGMNILQSYEAYVGIFLTLYLGLFFLNFKTFTNKNNANDNTSGVAMVLSIIEKLDGEQLSTVAFILFDNEEKGLRGSKAYLKEHKTEMEKKLLINFDCVANGQNVLFIVKPFAKDNGQYKLLEQSFVSDDEYSVEFCSAKECVANSDHKSFKQGVCVVACKKSKKGVLYTPYIHTKKDVVASEKNVEFLSNCACNFVKFCHN